MVSVKKNSAWIVDESSANPNWERLCSFKTEHFSRMISLISLVMIMGMMLIPR